MRCKACGNPDHTHWASWGEWICYDCYQMWRDTYYQIVTLGRLYGRVA